VKYTLSNVSASDFDTLSLSSSKSPSLSILGPVSYRICTFVSAFLLFALSLYVIDSVPVRLVPSRPLSPTKFLGQTHTVFHSILDLHPVTSTRCSSLSAGLLLRRDEKGNALSVLALPCLARARFSLSFNVTRQFLKTIKSNQTRFRDSRLEKSYNAPFFFFGFFWGLTKSERSYSFGGRRKGFVFTLVFRTQQWRFVGFPDFFPHFLTDTQTRPQVPPTHRTRTHPRPRLRLYVRVPTPTPP